MICISLFFSLSKSQAQYIKAHNALKRGELVEAQKLFGEYLSTDPEKPAHYLEGGLSYWYAPKDKVESIPWFEKAVSKFNGDTIYEVYYYLGKAYHFNEEYQKAVDALNIFKHSLKKHGEGTTLLNECEQIISWCYNAIDMKPVHQLKITNVEGVNTIYPEYAPVLRPGTNAMLFTTRRASNVGWRTDLDAKYFEDVRVAERQDKVIWRELTDENTLKQHFPAEFNSGKHEATVLYSKDGSSLLLFKNNQLWRSNWKANEWTKPELVPITINNKKTYVPSATLDSSFNVVYFSSDRKGGKGGRDIYKATLTSDGWSEPENISALNTTADEDAPFLGPSGSVLYFASNGNKSIGGYDLFSSTIIDSKFTPPVNMGTPINSPGHDIYLFTLDSNEYYFSSDRKSTKGDMDIYQYYLIEPVDSTIWIVDVHMNDLLPSNFITVKFLNEGDTVQTLFTNPQSGKAEGSIAVYERIQVLCSINQLSPILFGYMKADITDTMYIKVASNNGNEVQCSIINKYGDVMDTSVDTLVPALVQNKGNVKKVPDFGPIRFGYENWHFDRKYRNELDTLVMFLKSNDEFILKITGHTDGKGAQDYNLALGQKRATQVSSYLISKGISPDRIEIHSAGASEPVAPNTDENGNDNPKGRELNRRVELKLVNSNMI